MKNFQIISKVDPLRFFKLNCRMNHPEIAIFEHPINRETNIAAGYLNGNMVKEILLTDGGIVLQKKSALSPTIIYQESLVRLSNGISIELSITDASYVVILTSINSDTKIDIHVEDEQEELLSRIVSMIENNSWDYNTSSIYFTSPTLLTLKSYVNGKYKIRSYDFKKDIIREKKKRH